MTIREQPVTTHAPPPPPLPSDGLPTLLHPPGGPQKIGPYTLLAELGRGGMGIVYRAFDSKLGREVALKTLHLADGDGFPEDLLRFRNEAETLGLLQHPNIVSVYDFGTHDGNAFLVMEYIIGGTLDASLRGKPRSPRQSAEMAELLARAVHAAHERGIVHRDLKPGNVLLTADGSPKVSDFGLAKRFGTGAGLTQTGAVMGTPSYMAPEQARGNKDVGPAADVYALGAILYEMMTGRPPFRGATWQETLEQVCDADPAPPSKLVPRLPRDLQNVCLMCLHKNPARRYESAKELADDLRAYLDGLPVKARPPGTMERAVRAVARRPLTAAMVVCGATIAALAGGLALERREGQIRREADAAKEETRLLKEQAENEQRRVRQAAKETELFSRTFDLALRYDLSTLAGLEQLHRQLDVQSDELERQITSSGGRRTPLARAFLQLAVKKRLRGAKAEDREEALKKADALARLDKDDDEALFTVAATAVEAGRAYADREKYVKARETLEAALKRLEDAPAAWDGVKCERLRGEALHSLATVLVEEDPRSAEAQAAYEKALAIRRRLAGRRGADADDRHDLARTLGYLGDVYLEQGKADRADAVYWESHRLREAEADAAPGDLDKKFQLARSWANFGNYHARQRALTTALWMFDKSRAVREAIVAKQPDNVEYVRDLAGVLDQRAELLMLSGGPPAEAAAAAARAVELAREASAGPKALQDGPLSARLAQGLAIKARAALLAGDKDAARRDAVESLATYGVLREGRLTADELYHLAAAHAIRGDGAKAKEELERAFAKGFRRLAFDEVKADRAFEGLREEDWFAGLDAGRK